VSAFETSETSSVTKRSPAASVVDSLSERFELVSTDNESVKIERTYAKSMEYVYRDSSADGAEDSTVARLSEDPGHLSSETIAVPNVTLRKTLKDSLSQSQRSMTVSTLQSGIYLAKSVTVQESEKEQNIGGKHVPFPVVRQQFPLLQNLKETGRYGTQRPI